MSERIERELWLPATPDAVWDGDHERRLAGGPASASSCVPAATPSSIPTARVRSGWVEDVSRARAAEFWWAVDDEPASRVELRIEERDAGTRLRSSRRVRSRCSISSACRSRERRRRRTDLRSWRRERPDREPGARLTAPAPCSARCPTRPGERCSRRSQSIPPRPPRELASELPISRQAVLKHLNALTDAGLLDRTRAGREVRYQFTPEPLSDAVGWMAEVGAEWDERLATLRRELGTGARSQPLGS